MPQTGPQTEAGKHRSSLNSLKHGVFTQNILRCKKARCFYAPICPLCQNGRIANMSLKDGDKCPIEIAYCRKLTDDFRRIHQNTGGQLSDLEETIIMTLLQIRRAQMMISLDPAIARSVPSNIQDYDRPALALGVRYRIELSQKLFKLVTQFNDQHSSICPVPASE